MLRYGKKKTIYHIHSHDKCKICSPENGDRKSCRREGKEEIEKEYLDWLKIKIKNEHERKWSDI